jgi:hypothetical protein
MPRGIPRNRDGEINKMEGMRRAVDSLGYDRTPTEYQDFLKSEFNIDMDRSMISNYKSGLKTASRSAKIRKPGRPAVADVTPASDGITLDDIRAVKQVVEKVGADKVRKLAEVLGK